MVSFFRNDTLGFRGVTLMELLVATLMVTMVFIASTSVYLSAAKFLSAQVASSQTPALGFDMEDVIKKISLANEYAIDPAAKWLDLRGDYPQADPSWSNPLNTPSNFGDDTWAHYRICGAGNSGGTLRTVYDNAQGNGASVDCAASTVVASSLDPTASIFTAQNPTALNNPGGAADPGSATVIQINLVNAAPTATLESSAILGAKAKR